MESIAIIGIGCRFPGAENPPSFWQLLRQGKEAITEVPSDRWDIQEFYDPEPGVPGKMSTRWGGFLKSVAEFDAAFFNISPREAERMDPQHRLSFEVAWEALENAAIAPANLSGSPTGVFLGIGSYDYGALLFQHNSANNAYNGIGTTLSLASSRLSYFLNLQGPSLALETACSSSLVSVHYACHSLRSGESDLCLAGGVSLMLTPQQTIAYSHAGMMSPDGRCKTFDASANGYVRGEGCGVVVLKRLDDAIADQDRILAVIKGSAVNQDGLSNGITAPNGPAQQAVIRQAIENAGIRPADISYIEAHGTGTSLGDPIEVNSLKRVLMKGRDLEHPCWLGSVKTNIGHLEAAAGIAGLIKVVLMLQHREIPPHLNLKKLNPYISLKRTSINIPTECQPWSSATNSLLAGISSFGFGGTNAHIILEEPPTEISKVHQSQELPGHLLTLSAKSEKALKQLAQSYEKAVISTSEPLEDICFTSNTGRSHFDYRLAIASSSLQQLAQQLNDLTRRTSASGTLGAKVRKPKQQKVAFLFTGQGSQYTGMGRYLYETQSIFRQTLDRCNEILAAYLDRSLLDIIYQAEDVSLLNQTAYTQPALFALEYSLAQLWLSWGIKPSVVMGHSVGEYVAATIAGVFSLEAGLKLIAARGRLMQALPQEGAMIAVLAGHTLIAELIQPYEQVAIAAINGPKSTVISGDKQALEAVAKTLDELNIKSKQLQVSHAFHSPMMQPMLAEFAQIAAEIDYSPPQLKIVSNLTGQVIKAEIASVEHWVKHIVEPVKFAIGMETLEKLGYEIFLEIGSKPILLGMGRYCLDNKNTVWLPSLRPDNNDWSQLLASLAQLYMCGLNINWSGVHRDYQYSRVELPTYPFQRQRYWIDAESDSQNSSVQLQKDATIPLKDLIHRVTPEQLNKYLSRHQPLTPQEQQLIPKLLEALLQQQQDWQNIESLQKSLYETVWQLQYRSKATNLVLPHNRKWLIFCDRLSLGINLRQSLEAQGHLCFCVHLGTSWQQNDNHTWTIDPANPQHFPILLSEINQASELAWGGIIHLWGTGDSHADNLTVADLEQAQTKGCRSILNLLQSLLQKNITAPLWIVTRGNAPVGSSLSGIAQTPLWGLGKVIAIEHPELWGGMIDLDPELSALPVKDEVAILQTEIADSEEEDYLAFREGKRYVTRLIPAQPLENDNKVPLKPNYTYLITGGLGALGLRTAQWMIDEGVTALVLQGRRGASPKVDLQLQRWREQGVNIRVVQADVSSEQDMTRVFQDINKNMPVLKGIVHGAGLVGYQPLKEMDWQQFYEVLQPKVMGTWILHRLTVGMTLDFMVSFSSIAAAWGSQGQGHYAAANYFLDACAHYRQGLGLAGSSISWGPWSGGGMVSSDAAEQWLTRLGVSTLTPEKGILALGLALAAQRTQMIVADVNWTQFKPLYEVRKKSSFLQEIAVESPNPEKSLPPSKIVQQLAAASSNRREDLLITHLQQEVARILKLNSSQIPDPEVGFFDIGMDSLMIVELKTCLENTFAVSLPATIGFEAPTIKDLANYLIQEVLGYKSPEKDYEGREAAVKRVDNLSKVQQISETELEASIAQRLARLENLVGGY